MLEMRAVAAVDCHRGPAILQNANLGAAGVDHGLDGEYHPRLQPRTFALRAKVRNLGIFMHATADSMADEVADDAEALCLAHLLHGRGDVTQPPAYPTLLDGLLQRSACDVEQLEGLRRYLADSLGHGSVGVEAVDDDATVDREDVAVFKDALRVRHPVDNLLVDRGTQGRRIAMIALEGGDGAQLGDLAGCNLFKVHRGGSRHNMRGNGVVDLAEGLAGDTHLLDLLRRFDHDCHGNTSVSLD